jgi:putative ABC transport system permease protein
MAWYTRLLNLFRDQELRAEIDEELRYHIEARIEDNIAAGMTPREAREDALRRFGGAALALDNAREADIFVWLDSFLLDLRYGIRNLISHPGVSAVAVLSLALAMGATTAIFSVVNAVLLRALPYKQPNAIVLIRQLNTLNSAAVNPSVPNFEDWRRRATGLEQFAQYREAEGALSAGADTDWVQLAWINGDFFQLFGRNPVIGSVANSHSLSPHEAVISHRLWLSRFGGSPDLLGRTINVSGIDFDIVAVMPDDFGFPSKGTQLWLPATVLPNWDARRQDRQGGFGTVIARLKPGSTIDQARTEMQLINGQLISEFPEANQGRALTVVPLAAEINGKRIPFMLAILFGAVLVVLFIACANTANLLLARGTVRKQEIALRLALGACRSRILRQLLTESMVLSLLAGALGLAMAASSTHGLIALAPRGIARLGDTTVDIPVVAFSFVLSVLSGITFGLAPSIRASRSMSAPRQTAGIDSQRMRRAFVVTQVALAVVLLSGAGLLLRSFIALQAVDPGFQIPRVLTATLRFRDAQSADRQVVLYRDTISHIAEIPGVTTAGAVSVLFYNGDNGKFGLRAVEGKTSEVQDQWTPMTWSTVSGDYFQALGVPLLRGRFFNGQDTSASTPVVIINETMARRYWPGEDPIGKGIKGFDPRGNGDEWVRVVGVVQDIRSRGLERVPMAQIFEAQAQSLNATPNLVVRTNATLEALRNSILSLDHRAVITDLRSVGDLLREQNAPRRFQTFLLVVFAAIALMLAGSGIFATMHYSVAQRTREIGIRIAIGAKTTDVIRAVVGEGLLLVALGLGIGLTGAFAVSRFIRSLLFEVAPGDPLTLAAVASVLAGVALVASYFPARRAMRVDPMQALRSEN